VLSGGGGMAHKSFVQWNSYSSGM